MNARTLAWRTLDGSGVSQLCSRLTKGRLQILCYHGFSFVDEHRFRGKLFMTPALFEQRLAWLKQNRFAILELGEAVRRLQSGRLKQREIVITIDDGFHSVYKLAAPLMQACAVTATVYVTSYYVTHQHPIFRLAIQYMAWKSDRDVIDFKAVLPEMRSPTPLHGPQAEAALELLYETAESRSTEDERVVIAREFGRYVGVDYDELVSSRRFSLMSPDEITALRARGLDVQLHTHRHRLPLAPAEVIREIADNRAALAPLTQTQLEHFCYPSGLWDDRQWPTLSAQGIKTATTCAPGFNSRRTPLLGLCRFLDGQNISMEEFAAEMHGVKDLYRRIRRR